jgi:hypothetical protein
MTAPDDGPTITPLMRNCMQMAIDAGYKHLIDIYHVDGDILIEFPKSFFPRRSVKIVFRNNDDTIFANLVRISGGVNFPCATILSPLDIAYAMRE